MMKRFCKLLAQCEYPIYTLLGGREIAQFFGRHTGADDTTMRCSFLLDGCAQSPKSPNPDLSYMPSNDVSCPYEHLIMGDFGVWMRLYLCKIFARWVYKNTNARDDTTMRCFFLLGGTAAVGNSPLILDESPFRRIRQMVKPRNVVLNIVEFSEMEIRPKLGVSCRRLGWMRLYLCKIFAT